MLFNVVFNLFFLILINLPSANSCLTSLFHGPNHYHFRKWKADDTWLLMHQLLHEQTRRDGGKQPSPRVAIIDSQSVKTNELAMTRGFDGYKKVRRRKRHLVTDMTSTPLMVRVTDANVSDNQIAIELLTEVFSRYIAIQLVCAETAYRRIRRLIIYGSSVTTGDCTYARATGVRGCSDRTDCCAHVSWFGWIRVLTLDYERYFKS